MSSTRHRWGKPVRFGTYKAERECARCGVVKVSRHEFEGGREVHWQEFWRDEERIHHAATPPCDARIEQASERAHEDAREVVA